MLKINIILISLLALITDAQATQCAPTVGGFVRCYEDQFKGGVTVGGYSPTYSGSSTGNFAISIPTGSTIRKAFLIAGRHGNAANPTVTLNGINYTFSSANLASPTPGFLSPSYGGPSGVHLIDVSAGINPSVTNYTLVIPTQSSLSNRYADFSLYVAFNNSNLANVNAAVFLNAQNFSGAPPSYGLNFTTPINNSLPVALSLMTGYTCDAASDSEQVKVNTTSLTPSSPYLGGHDINSGVCGGPLGSFTYTASNFTALSDDNIDLRMQNADALSNIQSALSSGASSFTLTINTTSVNNSTNAFWAAFVTYQGRIVSVPIDPRILKITPSSSL